MLVFSRERGESIMVDGPEGGGLVTVLEVRGAEVSLRVSHGGVGGKVVAGKFEAWTVTLVRDAMVKVGSVADVTVVDIRGAKVRLGIDASKKAVVHRLEVYEQLKRGGPGGGGGDADGLAGSRVPRPGGPQPPSLDVRLEEPEADG